MKLEDILVYMGSRRPVGTTLDAFLLQTALSGEQPDKALAQQLLDAEELFLPQDERTLSQLQNPRFTLELDNLPEGITGILADGRAEWRTDSSTPQTMDAIYTRSTLL